MIQYIVLFIISLALLWIGSGLAVSAITKISEQLHIRSFFVSFFLLGFFTSITEIMVGVNALLYNEPEIFVGNLIGSSVVVFIFIIPILAILDNGVDLDHSFPYTTLILAACVVGLPAILTLDNEFTSIDGAICIGAYGYFIYVFSKGEKVMSRITLSHISPKTMAYQIFKIVVGVIYVFIASNVLVQETISIARINNISPYIISIIVLAIGTNIPELSIAVRAILSDKKDIAFGDYVGSATLNTFEMGVLSLIYGKNVLADGSNYSVLAFAFGLIVFLVFAKSKQVLSRQEGSFLMAWYVLFLFFELMTGPGWKFLH